MRLLLFTWLAALSTARPSYIAVPADQIAFLDLSRVHVRVPRQTLAPPPPQPPQLPQELYQEDYQPVPIPQQYQALPQQYQALPQQYPGLALQQYQQQPIGLSPPPEPQTPARVLTLQQQPQEAASAASQGASARLAERPPDFGEYVDFGAHTGDNGAFGWYADYPINNHDDSNYRK